MDTSTAPVAGVGVGAEDSVVKRRRWLPVGALVVVVAAAAIVAVAWPRPHHHPQTSHLTLPPAATPESPGGRQMLALLTTGEQTTFHAVYKVTGAVGAGLTLEIWQAPPLLREDVVRTAGGHTVHSTTLIGADKSTQLCIQQDGGKWTCQHVATDPNDIVSTAASTIAGQSVSVTSETIGGRKATCFAAGGGTRLCGMANGIPVLIGNGQVSYELVSLNMSADHSAFNAPG